MVIPFFDSVKNLSALRFYEVFLEIAPVDAEFLLVESASIKGWRSYGSPLLLGFR